MRWAGGDKFDGLSKFGLPISTDAQREGAPDPQGYSPPQLILFGVIGCTGIDVVRLLEKMRQKLISLEIEATGIQPDEYPKPFTTVSLTYRFKGENLDPERVKRALSLSHDKYCMVSQTLAENTEIKYDFEIA
ncbi:MAG: OsmC family protein [Candidatus Zixiibacteriota bacterium]